MSAPAGAALQEMMPFKSVELTREDAVAARLAYDRAIVAVLGAG